MYNLYMYYSVYIVTNIKNGVLYIGVTNDLKRRIYEHKHKLNDGFTKQYSASMLVYYEVFENIVGAINREKQMKNWYRNWKTMAIEKMNPDWHDLWYKL